MEESASQPAFELEETLKRLGGHYDLFRDIVGFFFRDTPALVLELRAALETGDLPCIAKAAHRLKGTVLYLGAQPATLAAGRAEAAGDSRNLAEAAAAVGQLADEVRRLEKALAPYRP
jgi:HPt (histidine-containing phosphotransfer) domain-containing protein